MNSANRHDLANPSARRSLCTAVFALGLLLSFCLAAGAQQTLLQTPYVVLGAQTPIASVNASNVAVDSQDNVYFPNFYDYSINKIDLQGNVTQIPTTGLNSPEGLRFDGSGNLYICDAGNSRIVILSPSGVQTTLPMTGLQQPRYLAFDAGFQNLFISDRYAGILKYNLASQTTTVFATNLFRPEGVILDAQNNIYYGDGGTLLKNGVAVSTSLGDPVGLIFDKAGNLYVDGSGLFRIDPNGVTIQMSDEASNDLAIDSHGILFMPAHNGQTMHAYLTGPAVWGGRNEAYVGGRVYYQYANSIRAYYTVPNGVTLTSVAMPPGSPYGGDSAPSCFTATLCGANLSLGAFLPGPQPGYGVATFSDGTMTRTPLYGSGVQVEMGFSPGLTSQITTGITQYGGAANDLNGNVYVSDRSANTVSKVTGSTVTPLAFTGLSGPTKLAVDGTGSVYVLDSAGQRILKLDSAGNQTTVFARQGQGDQDLVVSSFAVDGATNVYLAAGTRNSSYVIAILGANSTMSTYATGFEPQAMAFDTFGTLYIGDGAGSLGKFDHFANYIPLATNLTAIETMAIEPSGTVYVAGFQNTTLRQVSPTGTVASYSIAGVNQATVVTVDNYGNLTVGDNSTHLLTFNDRTTQPYGFGSLTVGASSTLHHTLVNVGSQAGLTLSSISGDGPFTIDSGSATCIPGTTSLVAGGACEIGFTFTPQASGSYSNSGSVIIPLPTPSYSATGVNLALTGTGTPAALGTADTGSFTVQQGGTVQLVTIFTYPGTTAPTGTVTLTVDGSTANLSNQSCVYKAKHSNCNATFTAPIDMTVGTHTFTSSQAADSNYAATTNSTKLTVTVAPVSSLKGREAPVTGVRSKVATSLR